MKTRALMLALSVAIGLGVAFGYGGAAAFERVLTLPLWPLGAGLAMIAVGWHLNATRLRLLLSALGRRLTHREAFPMVLATEFSYAATPAGAGGLFTYIYLLKRRGVRTAEATALCAIEQLLDLLFFVALLPVLAALLFTGIVPLDLHHQLTLLIVFLCGGGALAGLVILKYRRLLLLLGRLLRSLRISRRRRLRLARAFVRFRLGVKLVLSLPRHRLLAVFAVCAGHWLLRYSVLYVLMIGTGAHIPWSTLVLIQMLALSAGQISLLPGGSGTVELSFSVMISHWLDPSSTAAVLLQWRFVTYYWYLIAGAPRFASQLLRPHTAPEAAQ